MNKTIKPQTKHARVIEGLQGGNTHSFISHGEPITLSSLHMGLIPHVVVSFKEGHVPSKYLIEDQVVGNTKTTERGGGESVVYMLKQFYAF